jgi:hypothetical protein
MTNPTSPVADSGNEKRRLSFPRLLRTKPEWRTCTLWAGLLMVFLLGFGIRLYGLKNPPLDFNAVVQLRSALIARSVYYQLDASADPSLRQQAISLGALEPYEPSILESLVGFTDWVIGSEAIWVSRIYTALFWSIGGIALFALARRTASFTASLLGLAFYFFLPFGVLASRSFQPDPGMVMWILLSAYAFYRWGESFDESPKMRWRWTLIAGVLGGIAILVKAVAGFFIMGMFAGVVLSRVGIKSLFKMPFPWVTGFLALIPSLIYYILSHGTNSGSYFTFWTVSFAHMLLTSKFYSSWLGMVHSLMSLTTIMAALLGVFLARKSLKPLLIGLWIGYGLFGLCWPYQYTTHDYYHITLIAIVALSVIPLLDIVMRGLGEVHHVWRLAAIGMFLFASGYSLWVARSEILVGNNPNDPIAWKKVGDAIPANSTFIALTGDYGYRLMYYGWRQPNVIWPGSDTLDMQSEHGNDALDYATYFSSVTEGMDYFLVTGMSGLNAQPELKAILFDDYSIYQQTDDYILFDLNQPIQSTTP